MSSNSFQTYALENCPCCLRNPCYDRSGKCHSECEAYQEYEKKYREHLEELRLAKERHAYSDDQHWKQKYYNIKFAQGKMHRG